MTIEEKLAVMIEYIKLKLHQEDFHGVRDACTEIEILQALIQAKKENK